MKRLLVLLCGGALALLIAGCGCWDRCDRHKQHDCCCPTHCQKVVVSTTVSWQAMSYDSTKPDTTYSQTTTTTTWTSYDSTKPDTTESAERTAEITKPDTTLQKTP